MSLARLGLRLLGGAAFCVVGPCVLALALATREARADVKLVFVDAAGETIERISPARTSPPSEPIDPEAVHVVAMAPSAELPASIGIASVPAPDGGSRASAIETMRDVPLEVGACPKGAPAGVTCARTRAFRVVFDDIDRRHPLIATRSVIGEVGGVLVATAGAASASARVIGPNGRHRAKLRVHILRMIENGPVAVGRDTEDAARLVREEIARASSLWGACGIGFGPPDAVEVTTVDPPGPWLLALGCGAGLSASGGELRFSVDGRELVVPLPAGTTAKSAARRVAGLLEKRGLSVVVSENGLSTAGARAPVDVLVRRKNKKRATITLPASGVISTDPTFEACIGRANLEDGLQHFGDADAVAGTLEERALVKAYEDGDPSTLDVFVVPSFGGDARIGESFIFADSGAVKNTVIVDRAGFRAHRASFTLAHEIGHVLLDQPGHPDDFGADTPTRLMDADAVNPTAFGPRRLELGECARALRQSGDTTPSNLLLPWPLAPL